MNGARTGGEQVCPEHDNCVIKPGPSGYRLHIHREPEPTGLTDDQRRRFEEAAARGLAANRAANEATS